HTMPGDDPSRYNSVNGDAEWKKKDPLVRFSKFLGNKAIWNYDKENVDIECAKSDSKSVINEYDNTDKQTGSSQT
ncbi:thiamine pyrophosphate-dependent enzyme, partial [Staphylococcus aureus]